MHQAGLTLRVSGGRGAVVLVELLGDDEVLYN
jgi:hypothetical protein